jgi:predicted membrane protein
METTELIYWVPAWIIAPALLLLLVAAAEIGFRGGRAHPVAKDEGDSLSTVEGAVLGLLALLLAFTYSLASSRFEVRQQLVADEANSIGTTMLRAGLVASPQREAIEKELRAYLDARVEFYEAGVDLPRIETAIHEAERLQDQLWSSVRELASSRAPTPLDALFVGSLNEMIDLHEKRIVAMRNHVPESVLFLLMFFAAIAVAMVSYGVGRKERRNVWSSLVLPLLIVAVVIVTIDLDRARRGFIQVSEQALLDLQKSWQEKSASPTAPLPPR